MAKGISLSIASDTRDFASGVARGVVEPLEDVSDVLQEVVKDGDKAGRELEDAMSDARQDTAKLASEYEDLNRKIREAGKEVAASVTTSRTAPPERKKTLAS
ncbi:hypothetical protein [Leucobacter soli]|uniref:hypothetical protein n=1 Tax=Leucobacter soli TaxID=2812850 RepID=UPI003620807D